MIGNSHLAAIMHGWRLAAPDYPNVELIFFGAPGPKMRGLEVRGQSLVPKSKRLSKQIQTTGPAKEISGDYDFFMLCALGFGPTHLDRLYHEYRAESFAKDRRTPISDECFARSLHGYLSDTVAIKLFDKLRMITNATIVLIPQPFPAPEQELTEGSDPVGEKCAVALYEDACARLSAQKGILVTLQPECTKHGALRTKEIYSRGAMGIRWGFSREIPDEDRLHMNGDYGSIVVREALGKLFG